jgi:hypothetical protein
MVKERVMRRKKKEGKRRRVISRRWAMISEWS